MQPPRIALNMIVESRFLTKGLSFEKCYGISDSRRERNYIKRFPSEWFSRYVDVVKIFKYINVLQSYELKQNCLKVS